MALMTAQEVWTLNSYQGEMTDQEANVLDFFINVCSETICNYTRRRFESGEFQDQFFDLYGARSVHLGEFPVKTIKRITLGDETLMESVDYMIDKEAGIIYGDEGFFAYSTNTILTVDYVAGYDILPSVLKQCILDFVNYKYTPPSQAASSSSQVTVGNVKSVQVEGVGTITYEGSSSTSIGTTTAAKAGGTVLGLNYSLLDPYVDLSKAIQPSVHRITSPLITP